MSKRNGWFVPVGTIADRLLLMKNVSLTILADKEGETCVLITNRNTVPVTGVTLLVDKDCRLYYQNHLYKPNEDGEIIIGDLPPNSEKTFKLGKSDD